MKLSFSWRTKGIEIRTDFNVFSFHLIDLKNIWKRKGINYLIDFQAPIDYYKNKHGLFYALKKTCWVQYWTPVWHEGRGPYLTIGFMGLRFMRGY